MIEKGAGEPSDYAYTWAHVHGALVRLSNRERCDRTAEVDDEDNVTKKGRTGEKNWIKLKKGTPFFVHVSKAQNSQDRFVQEFIEDPAVTTNEPFMQLVNSWPVSRKILFDKIKFHCFVFFIQLVFRGFVVESNF